MLTTMACQIMASALRPQRTQAKTTLRRVRSRFTWSVHRYDRALSQRIARSLAGTVRAALPFHGTQGPRETAQRTRLNEGKSHHRTYPLTSPLLSHRL